MRIAYLGPAGTFSQEAAQLCAGPEDELIPFASFPALVSAVETSVAQIAVLPIENSLEGSVSTTLDLLIHETKLQIAREVVVPVHLSEFPARISPKSQRSSAIRRPWGNAGASSAG